MGCDAQRTDRQVGKLEPNAPLPPIKQPPSYATNANLKRQDSETSVSSTSSSQPPVPRSSSFTRSKRFVTGHLSAREALGIIDDAANPSAAVDATLSYHAARVLLMGAFTLPTSNNAPAPVPPPPPPPPPPPSLPLPLSLSLDHLPLTPMENDGEYMVSVMRPPHRRPPTPPPLPDFSAKNNPPKQKRVRIDPKPPVELPAPIHSPSSSLGPTPPPSPHHPSHSIFNRARQPLRPLSPLRNRFSAAAAAASLKFASGAAATDPRRDPAGTDAPPTAPLESDPPLNHTRAPRHSIFGLFAARYNRREDQTTPVSSAGVVPRKSHQQHNHVSSSQTIDVPPTSKQNATPLDVDRLAATASAAYTKNTTSRVDENNKLVSDNSTDSSTPINLINTARVQQSSSPPRVSTNVPATMHISQPATTPRRQIESVGTTATDTTATTESERFQDGESPVSVEPRRRVELFRRFRFIQQQQSQRESERQSHIDSNPPTHPTSSHPAVAAERGAKMVSFPSTSAHEPSSSSEAQVRSVEAFNTVHDDNLSFTSGHDDDPNLSCDEMAPTPPPPPPVRRNPAPAKDAQSSRSRQTVVKDLATRRTQKISQRSSRPTAVEPKILEEEKTGLPHVESMTTSSSSPSKTHSDSPPVESHPSHVAVESSNLFSQVEMPHLRLGHGKVNAHSFLDGPSSDIKMSPAVQLRRDSHAAFLAKLQEARRGDAAKERKNGRGERETTPLGPLQASSPSSGSAGAIGRKSIANDGHKRSGQSDGTAGSTDEGEMRKTMSGLQRRLKEASAGFVNKARKLPRGASLTKLRSNSMKDVHAKSGSKAVPSKAPTNAVKDESEEVGKTQDGKRAWERSQSLPNATLGEAVRRGRSKTPVREAPKKPEVKKVRPAEKPASSGTASMVAKKPLDKEKQIENRKQAEGNGVVDKEEEDKEEFVTIKRVIRRVRRDGTEELVTKKVRMRAEQVLPNGDVVIKRVMKRVKDDGRGSETLTVLQVIPRRRKTPTKKTVGKEKAHLSPKKLSPEGDSPDEAEKGPRLGNSLGNLTPRHADKDTKPLGEGVAVGEDQMQLGERSMSLPHRRSSSRSKTEVVDAGGRWRRARSFGRGRADTTGTRDGADGPKGVVSGVMTGVKNLLPRSKSVARDRDTGRLGASVLRSPTSPEGDSLNDGDGDGGWRRKVSVPRGLSFHGITGRRKESGASQHSDGNTSWWRVGTRR